jgi:tetratricopeptide (TPR) repeat protein
MSRTQPEDFRWIDPQGEPDDTTTPTTPQHAQPRPAAHPNPATRIIQLGLLTLGIGELLLQLLYVLPAWLRGRLLPSGIAIPIDQEAFVWLTPLRILWPLALACWIARSPAPRLLRAAGATAFVLLVDRGVGMVQEVFAHLERQAGLTGTSPAVPLPGSFNGLQLLAGALQIAVFLVAAFTLQVAWSAARAASRSTGTASGKSRPSLRERYAPERLAELIAWSVGLALVAAQTWSLYLQQLQHLPQLRSWMMGPAQKARFQPGIRPASPLSLKHQDASLLARQAQNAAQRGDFPQARDHSARAFKLFREIVQEDAQWEEEIHAQQAQLCNNLAWAFITADNPAIWDPVHAIQLAQTAIQLAPNEGNYWNTLAVAQFRARDDQAARSSFARAMSLRDGGDGYDWFFLAQIEAREGRFAKADEWYERAARWAENASAVDPFELHRIHAEAAAALGKPAPTPPPQSAALAGSPARPRFGDLSGRRASMRRERDSSAAKTRTPLRQPPSSPASPQSPSASNPSKNNAPTASSDSPDSSS